MESLLVTYLFELVHSLGLRENMVSPLVELKAGIPLLHLENIWDIFDDVKWVLNLEFFLDLLWGVLTFRFECLFKKVDHLVKGVAQFTLELFECLILAIFEVGTFLGFESHSCNSESAFDNSLVVASAKS